MPPPKADEVFFCIVVPFVWGSKSSSSFMQGDAPAGAPKGMKTNEVCDRPLETFGAVTPMLLSLYWRFSFGFMLLDFHRSRTDLIRLRHLPQRGRLGDAHPSLPSPFGKMLQQRRMRSVLLQCPKSRGVRTRRDQGGERKAPLSRPQTRNPCDELQSAAENQIMKRLPPQPPPAGH